jgi:hypothetical protein
MVNFNNVFRKDDTSLSNEVAAYLGDTIFKLSCKRYRAPILKQFADSVFRKT